MIWIYSIEVYRDIDKVGQWVKELRYYEVEKNLEDFDLKDVEGKRRNAKFVTMTMFTI
jgi:hypothetical protein